MCTKPNEEFTTCIPLCPEMCRQTNGIHITCPPPPDTSCKPGCQCIKGFVRAIGGMCIPAYDCRKCKIKSYHPINCKYVLNHQ